MKWTTKQKEEVKDLVGGWSQALNLTPLSINYDFMPKDEEGDMQSAMVITSGYPYRKILLEVYPCFIKEDQDTKEQIVIHELIHYILAPITKNRLTIPDAFTNYEEQTVEHLAWYIWCLQDSCQQKDKEIQALKKKNK